MNKTETEELKNMLEQSAQEVKVKGDSATFKTSEQKEVEKELSDWKTTKHEVVNIKEFKIPHEIINVLLNTTQYNGLIFFGEGGIGKTVLTITSIKNTLKSNEWVYFSGYTTPLALYEFLYHNRNKKAIIIDDTESIFSNNISQALLKGALWDTDGQRIVEYSSKSEKATVPSRFIINANLLILCNSIPKENDINTRAIISRTIAYEVKFSFKQKMSICKRFLNNDTFLSETQKITIWAMLRVNVRESTRDFNFRTLKKLTAFVLYDKDKAEELFNATTEIDELKETYLKVSSLGLSVKEQIALFVEKTGKSRRTYFNIKKTMSA